MAEGGFSEQERAAIRQRAEELRSTTGVRGAAKRAREHDACLAAIETLEGADRAVAERLHVIVSEEAPDLAPRTWYGFPSYARDDDVVVFLPPASNFGTRYGTVGFREHAALDDAEMWPTSYAVLEATPAAERRLRELVRRAAG